jgi:hypothetical protein
MRDTEIAPAVRRCFCQIAVHELMRWARLKYVEGLSTMLAFSGGREVHYG